MNTTQPKATRLLDADLLTRGAHVYKVLSHPIRLRIVEMLTDGQLSVCNLAEELGLPQASVSQHLNLLRSNGVIEGERDGQRIFYKVTSPQAFTMIQCLREHADSI